VDSRRGDATRILEYPRPADRDVLAPDLLLAPLAGFDQNNYRLGYGGGYFDRTLASLEPRPIVIGVGYDFSALETIFRSRTIFPCVPY
jgi:5-formyltetrahydrofolate cyclo-ligase